MNTDQLIHLLARDAPMLEPRGIPTRVVQGFGLALALTAAFALIVLGGSPLALSADVWVRLGAREAYCAALAGGGVVAVLRLSTPGRRARLAGSVIALAAGAMGVYALVTLWEAPRAAWEPLIFGNTWRVCSALIAAMSVPYLAVALLLMRARAPTDLRLAGAASGLAAGALSALTYTLHCPELAPPFLFLWYGLGVLVPALVGAVAGPRFLRW
jgi:hypothetical protein